MAVAACFKARVIMAPIFHLSCIDDIGFSALFFSVPKKGHIMLHNVHENKTKRGIL